ncbi:MAG: DUF192 domain-containing protein [Azoarcus sp.]|jgi:uncharacterized membrane protein (UPF0127 family)|nr:DUF192 domain-containing protein [Azoarcus sp.]
MKKTAARRVAAVMAAFAPWTAGNAAAQMPQASLYAGKQDIEAEVAANDADRQLGLMYRGSLPEGRGMVFVFPSDAHICMWMKNTLIPLSVAFIDHEGRILNIEDMAPQSEDTHCAAKLARYALEMNRGWFARHGIEAGDMIEGMKSLPPGR